MKHIFGFGQGNIDFSIEKGQLYHLVRKGQTIARFDTEEKARVYAEGLIKGIEWGYSSGYELGYSTGYGRGIKAENQDILEACKKATEVIYISVENKMGIAGASDTLSLLRKCVTKLERKG